MTSSYTESEITVSAFHSIKNPLKIWLNFIILQAINPRKINAGESIYIGVNLTIEKAVETAAIQTKPAYAGFKTLVFLLVRAGGLRFYSREFHEAVGELVEGQAPHPVAMLKLLHLIKVQRDRT